MNLEGGLKSPKSEDEMRNGVMLWNVVNTWEVDLQINLEFLLVRWIVFVSANLKLSIKQGEGKAACFTMFSAVPLLLIVKRRAGGGQFYFILHYNMKVGKSV